MQEELEELKQLLADKYLKACFDLDIKIDNNRIKELNLIISSGNTNNSQ